MKKLLTLLFVSASLISLTGCSKDDPYTIKIGASSTPHAEILKAIQPLIEEKGYKLDIITFTDYITPNLALEDEDIDANYFQHITYLNDFNVEYSTHLVSLGLIHYEQMAIYKGKKSNLNDISNGDTIIVPNDTTNEARALLLLEQVGLIDLDDSKGLKATKNDIIDNPKSLNILEMNAELIPGVKDDAAFAIINGNYALGAGLTISDSVAVEDGFGPARQAYGNVVAVKEGKQNSEKSKVLLEALTSKTAKDFIKENYAGVVIPLF